MKKLLFLTVLALTAINVSASEDSKKTNEVTVLKTIGSYVWHNPIKCTLATLLAVDVAMNGYKSSVAQKAVKFAQESGKQFLQDGKVIQQAAQNTIASIKLKIS
jgi:hypothetical protein